MAFDHQKTSTLRLLFPSELQFPSLSDGPSSLFPGSISGRCSSIGFSSTGESISGTDWIEEIELALQELVLQNERESKAEKISNENIESFQLTKEEEKEIQKRIRSQLSDEFKKIYNEGNEKNKVVRKTFRTFLEEARDTLLKARVKAEQMNTENQVRTVEKEHAKILQKRAKRKSNKIQEKNTPSLLSLNLETEKEKATELGYLRKIQSELDRLHARSKRQRNSAMREKKKDHRRKDALLHLQLRRLERDREVHSLILEIYDHGLLKEARKLTNALSIKEDSQKDIQEQMRQKKASAKERALDRLRKERIKEKERKELERIEQERLRKIRGEEERRKQLMSLLKKNAKNIERRSWAMTSYFNTRLNRAYTFSYF